MGEPAATLSCPHCGAPAESGRARCGYCRGALATVRCAACFRLSPPDALCCAGCGRTLGLQPVETGEQLACPRCGAACAGFHGSPGDLYECKACGGQFVEHDLLRELLERRELIGEAGARAAPAKVNPALAEVRYLRCPRCPALMNRKNFGRSSGVVVDICSKHGVWFDGGELPLVLAFVESGGLARARRLARQEEQARAPARGAPALPPVGMETGFSALGETMTELAQGVLALVAALGKYVEARGRRRR